MKEENEGKRWTLVFALIYTILAVISFISAITTDHHPMGYFLAFLCGVVAFMFFLRTRYLLENPGELE